ncbi:MAG: hypothetical protein KBD53_08085 [Candidatus Omnitrophica bacterium]|nr:hypothetical protein [Candidatus Omnitrophota bacterium]
MSVKIHQIPGQIPPFWDRSVAFLANMLSLFYGNMSETNILKSEIGALETYGSRLVPLINLIYRGPHNILFLEVPPNDQLITYFTNDLKLSLPEIQIFPYEMYEMFAEKKDDYPEKSKELIRLLLQSKVDYLDGYLVDSAMMNLAEITGKRLIGTKQGCRNGNNKLLLHQFLQTMDLAVFDSYEADSVESIKKCMQTLKADGYHHVVVKAPIGFSGVGMHKVSLDQSFENIKMPEYLFFEKKVLVQGWIDETVEGVKFVGSPSVQIFVDDQNVYIYDLTDQILNPDCIHEGNVAPPVFLSHGFDCHRELFDQAEVAGQWLFDQGYRGTGSIDFQVIAYHKKIEVRICEINARITGATYPSILARTFLPKGAWLMRNICFNSGRTAKSIFDVLNDKGLLFKPGMSQGIMPFNFNAHEMEEIVKGQFLFLGPEVNDVFGLLKRWQEFDCIKGEYERV